MNARGDYYEGNMTAAEKETLYKHTVRDFTNSHKLTCTRIFIFFALDFYFYFYFIFHPTP